jgi:hypothetical protein
MRRRNGQQPHDLDSLKLIMDCRVKPGNDAHRVVRAVATTQRNHKLN